MRAVAVLPYGLYVPDRPAPPAGYGMTLNLHFCGGNYNNGPPDAAQLADRASGSLVLTPEGRGRCFWYWGESGADVFEAWADAGRHFRLDSAYNAISGWSMGGYGTYKLAAEFPDLFAAALPDIGCVSAETGWPGEPTPSISGEDAEILNLAGSLRNIPFLMANANMDVLCDTNPEQETNGTSGSFVFTGSVRTWQQPERIAATDELDLTLTNIATVTIDTRRAHIGCDADLHVTSDGPATVTLAGCHRTIAVQ